MNTKTKHTPGAIRIAEIIIPEGIDRKGRPSRIATAYGKKTREGIADMIDHETAAPELLVALKDIDLRATQARIANGIGKTPKEKQIRFLLGEIERIECVARAAIAKAEGGEA